jgi:hypothetical protein
MRRICSAKQRVMTALTSALFAMAGCHSGSSDDAKGSCSDLASAYCAKLAACSPLALRLTYGDQATCANRIELTCSPWLDLPGTSWTAAKFSACTNAIAASSCPTPVGTLPECMTTAGSLSTGDRCADPSQCATGFCNGPGAYPPDDGGVACGTCLAVPSRPSCGDAGACVLPELCLPDGNGGAQCVRLPQEGGACLVQGLCDFGLVCIASVCSRPKGAGASCAAPNECDISQSLVCLNATCQMPTWVQPGSACHDPDQLCSGGACIATGIDVNGPGICMAWAADGSACDPVKGPPCLAPALCLAGKCQPPGVTCQ